MIHWCMEETLAVMSMLPFTAYWVARIRAWYHSRKKCVHHPEAG